MTDTIFAPATPPGRAAIAVVRLSGPGTAAAVTALARRLPRPRRASLRTLLAAGGEVLDRAVVIWTPGPASYTGEDAAELQLHGGPAVVDGVVEALIGLGLRLAEPGEFTRRAFVNGRMDLVEAEGVADLVDAESAAQRRQALAQVGGAASARHAAWRETLLEALAHLEAAIDFPDEDLPTEVAARARAPLSQLRSELESASQDRRGERVREGLRVALIGPPNAGKSTLLNALLGRDAAIVTPIAGTTRDVVEGRVRLAGVPAVIADTAGLRDTADEIEAEGVRRARAWARDADLRVLVLDRRNLDGDLSRDLLQPGDLVVENKADLPPPPELSGADIRHTEPPASVASTKLLISAHSVSDIERVRGWLQLWAGRLVEGAEPPAATRVRHRLAMGEAAHALARATSVAQTEAELIAEDVRLALRSLERLSGRVDPEEVLGRIFSTFCIGK